MDYRTSSCNTNTLWVGGCYQQRQGPHMVTYWHNITSPTPVPTDGQMNGGGACDCTDGFTSTASGSNWIAGSGGEKWQGSPQDLLTVQTFATGSQIDLGQCLNAGFKNVAARRQWHGTFGFTSNDSCARDTSIAADQTKYLSLTADASLDLKYIVLVVTGSNSDPIVWSIAREIIQDTTAGSISGTRSVNPNTGIITNGIITTQVDQQILQCTSEDTPALTDIKNISGGAGSLYSCFWPREYNYGIGTVVDGDAAGSVFCDADIPYIDYFIGYFNSVTGAPSDSPLYFTKPTSSLRDGWSNSVSAPAYYPDGSAFPHDVEFSISVSRSNTEYSWSISGDFSLYQDEGDHNASYTRTTIDYSGTLTLSDENTASDVDEDNTGLLSQWHLTNNYTYPWRTDNYTSFMPLVARREVRGNVSPIGFNAAYQADYRTASVDVNGNSPWSSTDPSASFPYYYSPENNDCFGQPYGGEFYTGPCDWQTTYEQTSWVDPNAQTFLYENPDYGSLLATSIISANIDGTIIGQPHPNGAGGEGWFDFYYDDIHYCPQPGGEDCVGPPFEQFTYAGGGTLSDANISVSNGGLTDGPQFQTFLPKDATHWVNNYQAHGLSRGAIRTCGFTDDAIWSVKWAETRPVTPSYNFFRPCGADRVLVDETTARNVVDGSMDGELTGLSGGSVVLVSGDGIYTGCSQSDNGDGTFTLTTGTRIADLPTDYSRPVDSDVVGFVRFPDAWAICGRTEVTCATGYSGSATGSVVTFLQPQTNLRSGDHIDLFNRAGSSTVSSQTVSRVDDSHFYLDTPYTGAITSSIYAMSTGAPDYHWNDTSQKFEYRYGYWFTSNRDASFSHSSSCATACVPFTPCAEQVVCFSPNGESFTNGNTYWFTETFIADGIYGSYQQGNVDFVMQDLLWQTPLTPPDTILRAEDGTCPENSFDEETGKEIIYYQVPRVEAMCSAPAGSPSLPSGVTFPAMEQPWIAGVAGYSFNVQQQPTNYYYNSLQHCTDGCRFKYFGC